MRIMTKFVNPDHIKGLFLGGVIGDAVGAVLEFNYDYMTDDVICHAIKLPGGGVYDVGEGQPTDDSELSFALLQVLLNHDPINGFPEEKVFEAYQKWYDSDPFDCGGTCGLAFSSKIHDENTMTSLKDSQANGALMRISPVSIWAMNHTDDVIAKFARQDTILSHPNQICQDCNTLYCIALAYLLRHPFENLRCIRHISKYITQHKNEIHPDVQKWFTESQYDKLPSDFNPEKNNGWVRWAFTLSFHFLRKGKSFETALYDVISYGGDVDTNSCIVMSMMGALHGIQSIPQHLIDTVLAFDCTKIHDKTKGIQRPNEYSTRFIYNKLIDWIQYNS
jgi:ADP-ribosyl-[dinitrogen reductase] hydrolase